MHKHFVLLVVVLLGIACSEVEGNTLVVSAVGNQQTDEALQSEEVLQQEGFLQPEVEALLLAYPDFIVTVDSNCLFWQSGSVMVYDDSLPKSFTEMLRDADIQDQMSQRYPRGSEYLTPIPVNYDPGRIRNESFFMEMYGSTEEAVRDNLVPVVWLPETEGRTVYVTSVNDVNEHLQAVSNELDMLSDELKLYLINPAGTFNWRYISGTERLSMHSFGIAIDINIEKSNYWKWDVTTDDGVIPHRNQIPWEIIEIFEKHGYIWGGKWYHYDTMHFEYRPEFFVDLN